MGRAGEGVGECAWGGSVRCGVNMVNCAGEGGFGVDAGGGGGDARAGFGGGGVGAVVASGVDEEGGCGGERENAEKMFYEE